jgi:cytochrome c-type biogenesis protein CcmH/NrfG
MAEESASPGGVRRNGYWTAIGFFLLGFIAGVALTAYKTSGIPAPSSAPHDHGPNAAAPSAESLDAMAASLRERAAASPGDPAPWAQLGHLYFDAGRYNEAIAAYETALERAPEDPNLWTDLGVMRRRADRPEAAIEAFDKAIAINDRHEIARFNRGIVLLHDLERPAEALAAWRALAEINPVFTTADGRALDELIRHYADLAETENAN